jgi:hypothetical protein
VVALARELTGMDDRQIHAPRPYRQRFTNPKAHELQIDGVFYRGSGAALVRRLYLFPEAVWVACRADPRGVGGTVTCRRAESDRRRLWPENCRIAVTRGWPRSGEEAAETRSRIISANPRRICPQRRGNGRAVKRNPATTPSRVMAHFIDEEPTTPTLDKKRDGRTLGAGARAHLCQLWRRDRQTKLKLPAGNRTARNMNSVAKMAHSAGMEMNGAESEVYVAIIDAAGEGHPRHNRLYHDQDARSRMPSPMLAREKPSWRRALIPSAPICRRGQWAPRLGFGACRCRTRAEVASRTPAKSEFAHNRRSSTFRKRRRSC